ncbi:MAG TPA: DUF5009 domain-containing protein [Verrucomicrobiae bacterium]|nr:DUF5009 domain-containing protein [Verrucomicrobiae bacterium]
MTPPAPASADTRTPPRLLALDAYRGFIMLAMASAGLGIPRIANNFPDCGIMQSLAWSLSHVTWAGCAPWDLIQPAFLFMVGVALPYSLARRRDQGEPYARTLTHAFWRALVLIALGVFLTCQSRKQFAVSFTNTLAQIGLAYPFAFLLTARGIRTQLATGLAIFAISWLLFATYPSPSPNFDHAAASVPAKELGQVTFPGFFSHWNKNANVAAAFDTWFLNHFPQQPQPFVANSGGYCTLNFLPSIITMLLGIMAGEMLRGPRTPREKLSRLAIAGAALLAVGWLLGLFLCPVVKRIWTPTFALYSGGWVTLILAAFFATTEILGWKKWAFPLVVVGMNSIAIYLMSQLLSGWIASSLRIYLGNDAFSGTWGPLAQSLATLATLWLACYWLFRKRIFLRI